MSREGNELRGRLIAKCGSDRNNKMEWPRRWLAVIVARFPPVRDGRVNHYSRSSQTRRRGGPPDNGSHPVCQRRPARLLASARPSAGDVRSDEPRCGVSPGVHSVLCCLLLPFLSLPCVAPTKGNGGNQRVSRGRVWLSGAEKEKADESLPGSGKVTRTLTEPLIDVLCRRTRKCSP